MRKLDPLIEGYLNYLRDVGRKTPRTVIDVRCTIGRVVEGMRAHHADVALWRLSLQDFLHWLERERQAGRSATSLAKYLSHVRGLLDYAWRSGRSERNVLDGFQIQDAQPRTAPRSLTLEEAQRLITACPQGNSLERRERLMILLLYGCGFRTQELCSLSIDDVNRERRELQVLHAKGDRPRVVPIPDGVYTELLAYLLDRGGKRGALFRTTTHGRRISAKDVCVVVKDAATRAQLAGLVTARTLRHSFATHLMDRGVDLAVIASLMGHRSPAETGVYLHVLPLRREAAVRLLEKGAPS
jgi:site-specific recombinase XerD